MKFNGESEDVDLNSRFFIKARLEQAGWTLRAIARELNIGPSTVTMVLAGTRKSSRVEACIAEKLQTEPGKLFPESYNEKLEDQS